MIVIDEIGTLEEAVAARTIAQRGVQLIATAHGNQLEVGRGQFCCRRCPWLPLPLLPLHPTPPPMLLSFLRVQNVMKNPSLMDLVGGICRCGDVGSASGRGQ